VEDNTGTAKVFFFLSQLMFFINVQCIIINWKAVTYQEEAQFGVQIQLRRRRFTGAQTNFLISFSVEGGRAIAQAVSRWLPTAAARVRARVWSCGIWGGQSGAGEGFLRVFRFPLPIFIPPIYPQSPSSIIWGWYNRPVVAAVSLTPLIIIIKK
jgi:hypothetical protein